MSEDRDRFKEVGASGSTPVDRSKSAAEETKEVLSTCSDGGFVPVKNWVKRSPTPDDKKRGALVAAELKALRANEVLIRAATAGHLTERACQMTHCFCPSGVSDFDVCNPLQLKPWIPTHEHYPKAARDKGTERLENVVLAHRRCNNVGHKLEALCEYLRHITTQDGTPLDPRAIEIAMKRHIEERQGNSGLYPRRRGSWRKAKEVALRAHQDLLA